MLSGARAFKGDDVSDTLAAVLRADVDWSRLPASTPRPLRQLAVALPRSRRRAAAARHRRGAHRARRPFARRHRAVRRARRVRAARVPLWRRLVVPAAAAVAAGAAVGRCPVAGPPSSAPPVTRFALSMPADNTLLARSAVARSRHHARRHARDLQGRTPRRSHAALRATSSTSSTRSRSRASGMPKGPFASPDGRWVGFFEPGPRQALCSRRSPSAAGPHRRCRASMARAAAAPGATTTPSSRRRARQPPASPDPAGRRCARRADAAQPRARRKRSPLAAVPARQASRSCSPSRRSTGGIDAAQVAVLDVASGTWKTLIRGASQAQYVPSGHLVYVAGGALWAVAFDLTRVETIGTAAVVVPQVVTLPTGVAEFDIARDGTLVYVARGGTSAPPRTLVWVDRQGREEPIRGARRGRTPTCGCRRTDARGGGDRGRRPGHLGLAPRARDADAGHDRSGAGRVAGLDAGRTPARVHLAGRRRTGFALLAGRRRQRSAPNPCTRARSSSARPTFCRTARAPVLRRHQSDDAESGQRSPRPAADTWFGRRGRWGERGLNGRPVARLRRHRLASPSSLRGRSLTPGRREDAHRGRLAATVGAERPRALLHRAGRYAHECSGHPRRDAHDGRTRARLRRAVLQRSDRSVEGRHRTTCRRTAGDS